MRTLTMNLSVNRCGILKWWVDASFAVHPNIRGHFRAGLSLVHGFTIFRSTKQKLNTKISTEMEIVGVDEFIPEICLNWYFIAEQGYNVKDNRIHQANKGSIIMEIMRRLLSASRRSISIFGISSLQIDSRRQKFQ